MSSNPIILRFFQQEDSRNLSIRSNRKTKVRVDLILPLDSEGFDAIFMLSDLSLP